MSIGAIFFEVNRPWGACGTSQGRLRPTPSSRRSLVVTTTSELAAVSVPAENCAIRSVPISRKCGNGGPTDERRPPRTSSRPLPHRRPHRRSDKRAARAGRAVADAPLRGAKQTSARASRPPTDRPPARRRQPAARPAQAPAPARPAGRARPVPALARLGPQPAPTWSAPPSTPRPSSPRSASPQAHARCATPSRASRGLAAACSPIAERSFVYFRAVHAERSSVRGRSAGDPLADEDPQGRIGPVKARSATSASPSAHPVGEHEKKGPADRDSSRQRLCRLGSEREHRRAGRADPRAAASGGGVRRRRHGRHGHDRAASDAVGQPDGQRQRSGITIVTHASGSCETRSLSPARSRPAPPAQVVEIERRGHETNWTWAPTAHSTVAWTAPSRSSGPPTTSAVSRFARSCRAPRACGPRRIADGHGHRLPHRDRDLVRPGLLRQADRLRRQAPAAARSASPTARFGAASTSRSTTRATRSSVPVIDRGPYANGADFDLTMATGQELGIGGTATIGAVSLPHAPPAARPTPRRPSLTPGCSHRRGLAVTVRRLARGPPVHTDAAPPPRPAWPARRCRSAHRCPEPSSPSTASPMLTVSGAPRQACAIRTEPAVRAARACAPRPRIARDDPGSRVGLAREDVLAAHDPANGLREPAERRSGLGGRLDRQHPLGLLELEQQQRQRRPERWARVNSRSSTPTHTCSSTRQRAGAGRQLRTPARRLRRGAGSGAAGRRLRCGSGSGRRCVPDVLAGALESPAQTRGAHEPDDRATAARQSSATRSGSSSRSSSRRALQITASSVSTARDARLGSAAPASSPVRDTSSSSWPSGSIRRRSASSASARTTASHTRGPSRARSAARIPGASSSEACSSSASSQPFVSSSKRASNWLIGASATGTCRPPPWWACLHRCPFITRDLLKPPKYALMSIGRDNGVMSVAPVGTCPLP